VKTLKDNPASEGDALYDKALADDHRHCISPDRLYEVVRSRVLFRPAHGEGSHSYEPLHSPRLVVVQDNFEVNEPRVEAVYATVAGPTIYHLITEPTTNNRPGKNTTEVSERMHEIKRVRSPAYGTSVRGGGGGGRPPVLV